ncbi:MAG: hypothetical protein LBN05_06100 [Oscillospiraceae bacterium]|jgi:hypothetical protein|nr:hypothetical protein [Oscillospiraceae bacterium]
MEYINILLDWLKTVIWPLIEANFTDIIEKIKELIEDLTSGELDLGSLGDVFAGLDI